MPPPSRPEGVEWEITDDWREWLERRMDEEDISQLELARRIVAAGGQATGAAISDILLGKTAKSRLVPAINAALGGIVPTQHILAYDGAVDDVKERISRLLDLMTREEQEDLLRVVEHLAKRK